MNHVTLHPPDEIFSTRHVPSWLMLTFSSGCVNAIAFVACERFVTHLTGSVTRVGVGVADSHNLIADFAFVLCCFVFGAVASALMINARAKQGKRPWYTVPLLIVAFLTGMVGIVGHFGGLGHFGGGVDEPGDFILLSILAFASGLQNASVSTSTGLLVRTTHLTGPATDLGTHLVEIAYGQGEDRVKARRHAMLRGGKIVAFVLGATGGVFLAHHLHFLAFLIPTGLILFAAYLSFAPYDKSVPIIAPPAPDSQKA